MPITTYALDLLATNPANRIVNEIRTFTTANSKLFVPAGGPFFSQNGLVVKDKVTGATLLPVQDYRAVQFYKEASMASNKEVCCLILVTKPGVTGVNMTYRVIGGQYSQLSQALQDFLENTPIGSIGNPTWGGILDKPATFPPSAHFHYPNEWRGYTEVILLLEQIRQAISVGDRASISAIYNYIDENLGSLVDAYLASIDPPTVATPIDGSSYLVGLGTPATPLNLDVDKTDLRYAQTSNLDLTHVGCVTDAELALSGSYFNIAAPRVAPVLKYSAAYIEPNGDMSVLFPATNGSRIRYTYTRWPGYMYGQSINTAFVTDTIYAPSFLAADESIQNCQPTTQTCMMVEIWKLVAGVEVYSEKAIVILNGSLRQEYHTVIRLGTQLETVTGLSARDVLGTTPSAVIIGNTAYIAMIINSTDIMMVSVDVDTGVVTQMTGWTTQGLFTTTGSIDVIRPYSALYTQDTAGTPDAWHYVQSGTYHGLYAWNPTFSRSTNAGCSMSVNLCQDGSKVRLRLNHAPYHYTTLAPYGNRYLSTAVTMAIDLNLTTTTATVLADYRGDRVVWGLTATGGPLITDFNNFKDSVSVSATNSASQIVHVLGDGTVGQITANSFGGGYTNLTIKKRTPSSSAYVAGSIVALQSTEATTAPIANVTVPTRLTAPTPLLPHSNYRYSGPTTVLATNVGGPWYGASTTGSVVRCQLTGSDTAVTYNDLTGATFSGYRMNNDRVVIDAAGYLPPILYSRNVAGTTKYSLLTYYTSAIDLVGGLTITTDGEPTPGQELTLTAAKNADITAFVETAYPTASSVTWSFALFPGEPTKGIITMVYQVGDIVRSQAKPISVTMSGGVITGFTIDTATLIDDRGHSSQPFSGHYVSAGVATMSNMACQYYTDVTANDTMVVLYKPAMHTINGANSGNDFNIRAYKRDKDGVWSEGGSVGIYTQFIAAVCHPTFGLGILSGSHGGGTMCVFKPVTDEDFVLGTPKLIITPRPASGFILNVTQEIPVILAGATFTLMPGFIDITTMVASPANKTLYCYVILEAGIAKVDVREVAVGETLYRVYIGSLTTDTTSITGSTLRPVTRLGIYRPSLSMQGSSLVAAPGRPDQTIGIDYWGRFPGISASPGNLISMNGDGVYYGITAPANVANVYVDSSATGNDVTGDGTRAFPWKTIAFALAQGPAGINRALWLREHQTHLVDTVNPAILRGGYCYIGPYGPDTDDLDVIPGDNDWACPDGIALGVIIRSVPSTYLDLDGVTEYKLGQCMWPENGGRFASDAVSFTVGATASTGLDSTYMAMIGSPHQPGESIIRWANVTFTDAAGELYPKGGNFSVGLARANFIGAGSIVRRGSKGMSVDIQLCSIGGVDKTPSQIAAAYFTEQNYNFTSYANFSTNAAPLPMTQTGMMRSFSYTMAAGYGPTVRQTQTLTALPVDGWLTIHSSNNVSQPQTSGSNSISLGVEVNGTSYGGDEVYGSQTQSVVVSITAGVVPVIEIYTGNGHSSGTSALTTITTYEFKPKA